jgi:hypothetical protein
MDENVNESERTLKQTIDAMAIRTRITALHGVVASGHTLTPEQAKELADLEASLAALKGQH